MNNTRIYKNIKRQNKFLGLIDYKSLVVLIIYALIIGYLLLLIPIKIEYKIYIFMFLVIPVIAVFITNIHNESVIDVIVVILRFYMKKCIFIDINLYKKVDGIIYKKQLDQP